MTNFRVLVTGSREFDDFEVIDDALYRVWYDNVGPENKDDKLVIIEGAAAGADRLAGQSAKGNPDVCVLEEYPALWELHGKAAGPIRNQQMLDTGADLVLAFYKKGAGNVGTQNMVDKALKAGVQVWKYEG
jgi:hypothetical protein